MLKLNQVRAGELDQCILLQQRSTGVDVLGQESQNWDTIASVWSQAQPLRGAEFFAAGAAQSTSTVRFRIRYRSDVVPTMRVIWRSQAHDITDVIDVDGGWHTLELMCSTGARDGR